MKERNRVEGEKFGVFKSFKLKQMEEEDDIFAVKMIELWRVQSSVWAMVVAVDRVFKLLTTIQSWLLGQHVSSGRWTGTVSF